MNKEQTKKVVNITLNVLLWVFVALALVATIVVFSASANAKNVPAVGGKCYLNVQSDSMNAEKPDWVPENKPEGFRSGAMIVGEYIAENDSAVDALEVGDIITYEWDINRDGQFSRGEYNTHRIAEIERDVNGHIITVKTRGDNPEYSGLEQGVSETVRRSAIIARYTGKKANGWGSFFSFLGSRLGFGLCILLPMLLFFGYEVYAFIRMVLKMKNAGKKMISAADEELIKQRAIEEYLCQQKEQNESSPDGETPEGEGEKRE